MPAANYGEVLETQPGCYLSVKRGLSRRDGTKVKYTAMPEAK